MLVRRVVVRPRLGRVGGLLFVLLGVAAYPIVGRTQTLGDEQIQTGGRVPQDWDVTVGIGVGAEPTFPGASAYRASPIPLVSIKYRDLVFLGPGGLGVNVIDWRGFRAGPLLGFGHGRDQSDDPHLNGLGNIEPSANAGGFVSYTLGPVRVAGTVRQAITHASYGLTGRLQVDYRHALVPGRLYFGAGPEVDFANDRYARTWFGVSPGQSAASGLPVFTPGGGVKDVGANANLTYRYTQHILLRGFVDVRELVGDVADSPIVQSKTQALVGAGVAYHF